MRDYNGTNLFFPPFFFVHRSVDFSLLFLLLPLCVSISIFAIFLSTWINAASSNWRYAISIRHMDSERVFFLLSLFIIPFPLSFYCSENSTFVCAFASRTRKIDLEKVANETQHGIGLRRTNSSRKRFLSLYPLLFPSFFSPSCSTKNKRIFST